MQENHLKKIYIAYKKKKQTNNWKLVIYNFSFSIQR